jgi:hypothetical protein
VQGDEPGFFSDGGEGQGTAGKGRLADFDLGLARMIRAGHPNLLTYPLSLYLVAVQDIESA